MKKIFSISTVLITLGALIAPILADAASPQFNYLSGDAKTLTVANRTTGTGWQDNSVSANANDSIAFKIYYHNGVEGSVAQNTRLRLTFPTTPQNTISATAYLSADNAPTVTDNVVVYSTPAQMLTIDSSSFRWYPNQSSVPTSLSIVSSGAGYVELGIGNIQGCWQYQGYVTFYGSLAPSSSGSPDLSISKLVRNQTQGQSGYQDSVNANANDRLTFQIQVTNTGNAVLNNVQLRDVLPSQLNYVNGSTQNNYASVSDGIVSGGINIGSIATGASRTVTFDATVNYFSYSQTVTNTAYARADQVTEKSDSASIYLSGSQAQSGNLTINKTVRNVTYGQGSYQESVNANANDRVAFQIQIQNNGSGNANNVFVRDNLPNYLSYAYGSARLDGASISDSLVSGGVNIGSMYSGSTKTLVFEATVNGSYYGYTTNQTVTNYAYVSADQISERNDSAAVYIGGQAPNPGYLNISKTVRNMTTGTNMLSSVNASVGDRILFLIQVTTPTNASQAYNVRVWDTLPAGLSYVPGSTRIDNGYTNDGLVSGGINLGTLMANQNKSINFEATVNSNYSGSQTLTNYAYASADNIGQQSAFAQVIVGGNTPYYPPTSSNLVKMVDNLTSPNGTQSNNVASVGDTLRYTITYANNSGSTLYGIQIWDVLPAYTTYLDADNGGYYNSSQNQVTWNANAMSPGATLTVSYRVKVGSVPGAYTVITNKAAVKSNSFSIIESNEVSTTVNLPIVKGAYVKAVTGGNDLARNIAVSLMISLWGVFFIYLYNEYAPAMGWEKIRFQYAIWRLRRKEKNI